MKSTRLTTTTNPLDIISHFLVGFDSEYPTSFYQDGGYPPHNVVQVNDLEYTIEFAVAGFAEDEISVKHEKTPTNKVSIEGERKEKDERKFHTKGISSKAFSKSFRLEEFVEVSSVILKDGILSVYLTKNIPDAQKAKTFTPNKGGELLEG